MRLFELDPNNPIDRELMKTSKDATNDGSLDQNDIDAQGEPMDPTAMGTGTPGEMGAMDQTQPDNAPEPVMGGTMDAPDATPTKPIDSALVARMQGHDYIQNYDHSDSKSSSHPINIMGKDFDELSQLRNRVRIFLDQTGMEDRVGMYQNPEIQAAQDMLSFVDQVMAHKKMAAKNTSADKKTGQKRPRPKPHPDPKIKPGQKLKPKTEK